MNELEYHKCNYISKQALITDCEPEPLDVVHLSLDSTHSCKARSTEKVEEKERETAETCECGTDFCPSTRIKDTHCTNDVFLSNKTCDRCNGCLPVAPAERCKIHARPLPIAAKN